MTVQHDNEQLYRHIIDEVWVKENLDVIDELVAEDCVYYDATMPEPLRGPAGMRAYAETWSPVIDGEPSIDQLLSADDWVVARFSVRGTHVGEAMGLEPTNEPVEVSGIELCRFENGQLVEGYQIVDALGFLQQIGAIPEDLSAGVAPAAGD